MIGSGSPPGEPGRAGGARHGAYAQVLLLRWVAGFVQLLHSSCTCGDACVQNTSVPVAAAALDFRYRCCCSGRNDESTRKLLLHSAAASASRSSPNG
jgi:hypothetical protein